MTITGDDARLDHTDADRAAIHARYRAERDKRLRADGNEQYVEPVGAFAHYLEDPYATASPRQPLTDEVTVAFIGGGFAGLVTGARLREAGIDDVRIIEKGGDFGGTWYWNRYPGAQCDTTSFVYMPLLEETGHMPTEKYAHAPEILEHCRRIGTHFDLYDNAVFSTEVTDVEWDDDASRWIIRTNRGDEMRAKYVCMGTGPLHRPKLPGIPGIETYAGHSFHTSRWDYDYTGGDPAGAPMEDLADKRVGIIGTGATSVQCIPHLARACGSLHVFQRTPSSIDIRDNRPTDPDWFENEVFEPGWQYKWLMNFTTLQTGGFADEDLVMDGWTDIAKRIRDKVVEMGAEEFSAETMLRAFNESDDEKMEEIRRRVDEVVADEKTAEALKPWYRQLCKRPCFHDEYLDAYNNPDVHLVDTDGKGVDRIDETGVWVAGEHYELDCLIYASGFEVGTSYVRRSGYDVTGRDGRTLGDHWADGMRS
ncbi:MAG: NAD(P)/FAD-dependent oxidoreductase, partial [Acidimicrobiales bacterium]|nr:NAD(P)/FAD-dependent oxidoreductase [Acidimicrobiales bacterium]